MKATRRLVMLLVAVSTISCQAAAERVHRLALTLDYQGGQPSVSALEADNLRPWVKTSSSAAEFLDGHVSFSLTKPGYDFAGYWTAADGKGVMIYNAAYSRVVTKINSACYALYAYWIAKPSQKKGLVIVFF